MAGGLRIGEMLATRAGADALAPVAIEAIEEVPGEIEVFDLTVVPSRSFFAAGVWAHNY